MLGSSLLGAGSVRASGALLSVAAAHRALPPHAGIASWATAAEKNGVDFVGSFVRVQDMPATRLPEITLAGRSNVGKSSALNTLAGRTKKKIAVVSKTPGRTRMINLFRVGKACTITDLPGYGYAKVSKEMQDDWRKQIEGYLRRRSELRLAILFVDAQRDPQEADAQLLDFLEAEQVETLGAANPSFPHTVAHPRLPASGCRADRANRDRPQSSQPRLTSLPSSRCKQASTRCGRASPCHPTSRLRSRVRRERGSERCGTRSRRCAVGHP